MQEFRDSLRLGCTTLAGRTTTFKTEAGRIHRRRIVPIASIRISWRTRGACATCATTDLAAKGRQLSARTQTETYTPKACVTRATTYLTRSNESLE